jgi:glycogen debranching enzyme
MSAPGRNLNTLGRTYEVRGNGDRDGDGFQEYQTRSTAGYEDFWDEQSGFYAFALDGEKKKVLSAASNVGQCLWSGIIAPERAGRVVKRLMSKDMWSGWGIRTLSADHPAFNPYNYQTGAVWPHDNSLIALGMRRCGRRLCALAAARKSTNEG